MPTDWAIARMQQEFLDGIVDDDDAKTEIMEGFERGGQLDPRIQLSHYEEEVL